MDKIKEQFKKLVEKFKELSKIKKIAFSVLVLGIITGIIYLVIALNTTKYAVLYKDMDPNDAQTVMAKLADKKIEYKVENNSIKVPEEKAAELRMELAPQLTNGSKGYEILDDGDTFGMTDKERELKYKRALEGELARDIKSLPEVKDAKVLLVMQQEGNFFKQDDPGSASVTLEFETGKKVTKEQIKAIVALVSGSVKNLPKENIKVVGVVNGKTQDLSEDLFKEDGNKDISSVTEKQESYKKNLEKEYVKKIMNILTPKYGDGVKAAVNVDVDFDASEKTSTLWDPNHVVRSEETEKDTDNSKSGKTSAGPVDNNMSNTYNAKDQNGTSTHEKTTKNYEVGKVEQKVVGAPGKIKKISASVTINDENLSPVDKDKINSLVAGAISYDESRGDIVSVEGMKFNEVNEAAAAEEAKKQAEEQKAKQKSFIYKCVGGAVAALAVIAGIVALIRKRRKKNEVDEEEEVEGIDMLIDDNVEPNEPLKPINFDEENENTHVEKEIKKYASEKPEQVVEIIKAWMAEDER
ncbi:flagellar basal-body MS-ring/collar protein FliF [Clostridium botulinum]|uniref:flagellar basal-body MS-ring/collar protein FliF n=1 Tax=Clostridium botulinum TaxID=1491 RepID=UPI0004D5BB35|nr:flagellar basal-body MS-ring/collar protein FliF [Clostridium botulinum]KEI02074.1 flagellar MS-ring protein [Clostridium botulinum C/D str. BKT75002]KEI09502.1 flagellar MS-ring protein [Clostridium botulinum C/D str. BKT2873]MCD3350256.1 flagellar basal body M-ring protein FliF [Clostridium botulinum D/C]MCD3359194.1 flagellar basal body M-ring protein FliF [Clostridium botulinum D/C]MCD3361778.1 flagellar basal body M-ring protein FliF [Clostridium botulinum D/C]